MKHQVIRTATYNTANGEQFEVRLAVDAAALMQAMANSAIYSKGHKATKAAGSVVVEAVPVSSSSPAA